MDYDMLQLSRGSVWTFKIATICAVLLALAGCPGTRAAYEAARSPEDKAFVVAEHYSAYVKEAADYKERGGDPGVVKIFQDINAVSAPAVEALKASVDAYKLSQTEEDLALLQSAIATAEQSVAKLGKALREAKILK